MLTDQIQEIRERAGRRRQLAQLITDERVAAALEAEAARLDELVHQVSLSLTPQANRARSR